jgi:excisionase family DNA binding protein
MTIKPLNSDGTYYTDQEMAQLLGISLGRLRNKLTAGSPLPPRIQPPGCRTRLWPREAVHAWLEQFLLTDGADRQAQQLLGRRRFAPRSGG